MSVEDIPYTLEWVSADEGRKARLRLVDQKALPLEFRIDDYTDCKSVCDAIADLTVRGAPAIGLSGMAALTIWATNEWEGEGIEAFLLEFNHMADIVATVRPTAVNLAWAVDQTRDAVRSIVEAGSRVSGATLVDMVRQGLDELMKHSIEQDLESCRRIGNNGADVLEKLSQGLGRPLRVQTHCNAGSLGTVRGGTATAIIYEAFSRGLIEKVWVDETRPVDQGARLTTWEMGQAGVPYTLVCDDMAGYLMQHGMVDAVVVGADRICANGDTANKIGTYQLAVLAKVHDVAFYVAAPRTSYDMSLATGDEIVIEQRDAREVRCMPSKGEWLPVSPVDAPVFNPAFDVTPMELITCHLSDD